jgi:hypothetical protein
VTNPRRSALAVRDHEIDEAVTAYWRNRKLAMAAAAAGAFHASAGPLAELVHLPEEDWQAPGPHAADPFPPGTDYGQNDADWDAAGGEK